jgi:hypothetical protein
LNNTLQFPLLIGNRTHEDYIVMGANASRAAGAFNLRILAPGLLTSNRRIPEPSITILHYPRRLVRIPLALVIKRVRLIGANDSAGAAPWKWR